LSKIQVLSHNFGFRCANKSIKSSKDEDHALVSKTNLSQKIAHWVGAQCLVNLAKTAKTPPHYDVTPRNIFFQSQLEDLLNP